RAGVEVDAALKITKQLTLAPNIAISTNKIKDYVIVGENGLTDYGTTNISFSPNAVAAMQLAYDIRSNFHVALLTKFVGEQYAGNIDTETTKLPDYSTTDFNIVYELQTRTLFKSIVFTGLVNNVFDKHYVSNAYLYGENYVSYFPQAGINFLGGITFKF
ncbi:MAG: TonB-dependent receptor, partial [Flavobacterium sp.]